MTEALPPLSTNLRTARYQEHIPFRGCKVSLRDIGGLFEEFRELTAREGETIVGKLVRGKGQRQREFDDYKTKARKNAFRVTVSIVGFNGQTRMGDSIDLFSAEDLPQPIREIYFTNTTSFKPEANGALPPNFFECTIHFDKPPLFDPNPLVSEPTPNPSRIFISAVDGPYFKAAQKIVTDFCGRHRLWYRVIHKQFSYDMCLWFVWVPYSLFQITAFLDDLPELGASSSIFKLSIGFYLFCLSLLFFRTLVGYIKWAFPVNVLIENKDSATAHRLVLGTLFATILYNLPLTWISKVLGFS